MKLPEDPLLAPEENPNDFSVPTNLLTAPSWRKASTPEQRMELVPRAMNAFLGDLESKRDMKVKYKRPNGEEIDAEVWNKAGLLTKAGEQYVEKTRGFLQNAAMMENGGLYLDEYTGTYKPTFQSKELLNREQEKERDPLSDYQEWWSERNKLLTEGEKPPATWEDYVEFANANIRTEEAKIDPEDKRLKSEWARRSAMASFSPDAMREDEIGQIVAGQMVINPRHYSEIDKVEAWIKSQEGFSDADKKLNLLEYRKKIEENLAPIINQFASADAGVVGAIFSGPLRDEFLKAVEDPNFSGYEFLKQNKDRFAKDNYGWTSDILSKFRDALIAGGSGVLFLAGKSLETLGAESAGRFLSIPAQEHGWLAESTAGAYNNNELFSIGGIEISRRDFTELTGQVGSFFAMGGMAGITRAGLAKTGLQAMPTATALTSQQALNVANRSLGQKALDLGKAMVTDKTAYLGGLQAAGMSFGRTYDQVMRTTGDREEAYREASIEGLSDGLSAFIATSVMNRFGMGMEKVMDSGAAATSGGLVQNIRARMLGREGMESVKKTLAELNIGDDAVRKAFATDLAKKMNQIAKGNGLKGLGIAGDVLSEGVEESMDELLSTVFSAMMRDSETWTEKSWENITNNWKDYVKAGILGMMGGGMGGAASSLNFKQTFGTSDALGAMQDQWTAIKSNIPKFEDNARMVDANGRAVPIAEMLAATLDRNPQKDIEKKSDILVNAALGFNVYRDATFSLRKDGAQAAPAASQAQAGVDAQEESSNAAAASTGAAQAYPQGSFGSVMQQAGMQLPEGRVWTSEASIEEGSQPLSVPYEEGGMKKSMVVTPLNVTGQRGMVNGAAAKVTYFENGRSVKTETVSGKEAHKLLANRGRLKDANQYFGSSPVDAENFAEIYEAWTDEQSTGSNGDSGAQPAASQEGDGAGQPPQGGGDRGTANDGPPQPPSSPKAVFSNERLKELVGLASQPLPGSDGPEARARANAIRELESAGLWKSGKLTAEGEAALAATKIEEQKEQDNQTSNTNETGEETNTPPPPKASANAIYDPSPEGTKYPEAKNGNSALIDVSSETIIKELDKLPDTESKLNWLYENGFLALIGGNTHVDYSGRVMVLMRIGDANVPFYISTGLAGKKNVKAGSWYAVWGIGKFGWINKGSEELINTQYGYPILQKIAAILNKGIGTIDSSTAPELSSIEDINSRMNLGIIPAADPYSADDFWSNLNIALTKINNEFQKLVGQVRLKNSTKSETNTSTPSPQTNNETQTENETDGQGQGQGRLPQEASPVAEAPSEPSGDASQAEPEGDGAPPLDEQTKALITDVRNALKARKDEESAKLDSDLTDQQILDVINTTSPRGTRSSRIAKVLEILRDPKKREATILSAANVSDIPSFDTGIDPDSTFIIDQSLENGGTDSMGGVWTRLPADEGDGTKRWSYRPPKGYTSSMDTGDTVVIAGRNGTVRVVEGTRDGALIFREVDINNESQELTNKGLKASSNKWYRSMLDKAVSQLTSKKGDKASMMEKIASGQLSEKEAEKVFKTLLGIVLPRKNFKVRSTTLPKGDGKWLYTETIPNGEQADGRIVIDYKRFAEELESLYKGADTSNDFGMELLAHHAASFVAMALNEEGIHVLTMREFTKKEIQDFYREIWDLNVDYRASQDQKKEVKDHPLFIQLMETAKERKVTAPLNPTDPNGVDDNAQYMLGSELLRKFVQLSLTGTTTERENRLSKMLQRAMILDQSNANNKKGINRFLASIGQMIRRYADRIRNVLWMTHQRGMMPPHLEQKLNRLLNATKQSGLNVDVFGTQQAALADRTEIGRAYEASIKEEIGRIARNNFFPMSQLRGWVSRQDRLTMEEILVHDPETMELSLHPVARQMIEKEPDIDLKAIDEVLASFNGKDDPLGRDLPALKKVQSDVFLKWERMQLLRDALPARFSAMDILLGSVREDKNGTTRVGPIGLFREILKGVIGQVPKEQLLAEANRQYAREKESLAQIEKVTRMARGRFGRAIFEKLDSIDVTTLEGKRALHELAKMMRFTDLFASRSISFESIDAEDSPNGVDQSVVNQEGGGLDENLDETQEARRMLLMQKLSFWLDDLRKTRDKTEIAKRVPDDLKELFSNYTSLVDQGTEFRKSINKEHRANIAAIKAGPDAAQLEQQDGFLADYRAMVEFGQAVDEYNNAIKHYKSRAIGEFQVNNSSHGTSMKELRPPDKKKKDETDPESEKEQEEEEKPKVFQTTLLEFVPNSKDNIGDVYRAHIFTSGVPLSTATNTDELADRVPTYTSTFIYPENVSDNLITDPETLEMQLQMGSKRERKQVALNDKEIQWNEQLARLRDETESNARWAGRGAWADYYMAKVLGDIRNQALIETYEKTAGFNFDYVVDEDGSIRYESLDDAIPPINHQSFNRVRRLLNENPEEGLIELSKMLENVRAWSEEIRGLYQGDGLMEKIGKLQTVAGRALPILEHAFSREKKGGKRPELESGLDMDLKHFAKLVYSEMLNGIGANGLGSDGAYIGSGLITPLDKDGKVMVREGTPDRNKAIKETAAAIEAIMRTTEQGLNFKNSLYVSSQAVKLVRRQVRGFMEQRWRRNIEREVSRSIVDPAYQSEFEQIDERIENMKLNPKFFEKVAFAMSYFETERGYGYDHNFGFEMFEQYQRLDFGEGYEPYIAPNVKTTLTWSANPKDGDPQDTVTVSGTRRDTTDQERFDYAEAGFTLDNVYYGAGTRPEGYQQDTTPQERFDFAEAGFVLDSTTYGVGSDVSYVIKSSQVSENNDPSALVVDRNDRTYNGDDPRMLPSNMSSQGSDITAWNQLTDGRASTPAEAAMRKRKALENARGYRDTFWAMVIGSNTATGRSSNAGRAFYYDLIQAEMNVASPLDQVLSDRQRMGSEFAPRWIGERDQLDDPSRQLVDVTDEQLANFEPSIIHNYHRAMLVNSLVDRGIQGIFPFMGRSKQEFLEAIKEDFLKLHGDGNSYNFTTTERFLRDLAEFKTTFEQSVVDRAIVRDGGVAAKALQTVLASIDRNTVMEDASASWITGDPESGTVKNLDAKANLEALSSFLEGMEEQGVDTDQAENATATQEEALNIWRLIRSEVMKPKGSRQVVDASKVVMLNSTVGPVLEQVVLNLPGNTIIVTPDDKLMAKHGLSNTGIRFFAGNKDRPNVVFLPQNMHQRDKRSSEEQFAAVAHGLSLIAKNNPAAQEQIKGMAAKVRTAMSPIIRASEVYNLITPEGKWRVNKRRVNQRLNDDESFNRIVEEITTGFEVEFDADQKKAIRTLVKSYFIESIEMARELEITPATAAQFGLVGHIDQSQWTDKQRATYESNGGDTGMASDILLVSLALSNAKAKQFLDQSLLSLESLNDQAFAESPVPGRSQLNLDMILAITDIARSGATEDVQTKDPSLLSEEEGVLEQSDEEIESSEKGQETYSDFSQLRSENFAMQEDLMEDREDLDAEEFDQEGRLVSRKDSAPLKDPVYMIASGVSDRVKKEILEIVRKAGGSTATYEGTSSMFTDADLMLINGMTTIISSAIDANRNVSPLAEGRDAREMLREPFAAGGRPGSESELEAVEAAAPVLAMNKNWKEPFSEVFKRSGKLYLGMGMNMVRPTGMGGRSPLWSAWERSRLSGMNAAVAQLAPEVQERINRTATAVIQLKLDEVRFNDPDGRINYARDFVNNFRKTNVSVPLTENILDELENILPAGFIQQARLDVYGSERLKVKGEIEKFEDERALALQEKTRLEQSLVAAKAASFQSARTAELDRQGGRAAYVDGFVGRIIEFAEEASDLDFFRSDRMAAAMSRFVAKKLSDPNDPFFRQSVTEMGHRLREMSRLAETLNTLRDPVEMARLGIEFAADPLVNPEKIEEALSNMVDSYNVSVDVVNLSLEGVVKQAFALMGIEGRPEPFLVKKLGADGKIPSLQEITKAQQQLRKMGNRKKFRNLIGKELSDGLLAAFSDHMAKSLRKLEGRRDKKFSIKPNKAYREFLAEVQEIFNTVPEESQRMEQVRELVQERYSEIGKFIEDSVMSQAEQDALFERGLEIEDDANSDERRMRFGSTDPSENIGQVAEQRDQILELKRKLMVVEDTIAGIDQVLMGIDKSELRHTVGSFYFRDEVGLPEKTDDSGRVVRKAIPPVMRQVPMILSFEAENASQSPASPEADPLSELEDKAIRRDFWRKREVVMRALRRFSEERLEDTYREARNTEENFLDFDPMTTIRQSVETAKMEMAILESRFEQANREAEMAQMRGLRDTTLAYLTDPNNPEEFRVLGPSLKRTVRALRMPKSFEERREKIGVYHNESGMPMILMPTTAAAELMRAFPDKITPRNVNSAMEYMVLAAVSPSQMGSPQTSPSDSYFFKEVMANANALFTSRGKTTGEDGVFVKWNLVKEGATREEVAEAFAEEYEKRIIRWMEQIRSNNSPNKKSMRMGELAMAQMESNKFYIRQLVMAYSSGLLSGRRNMPARNAVRALLESIDDTDNEQHGSDGKYRSFTRTVRDGSFNLITKNMVDFNPRDAFAKAFSEIEAEQISRRLVAGMTISSTDSTDLALMRLAHHHDARVRNRFRKSLAARQAMRHLVGILDYGFDGKSGREGYMIQKDAMKDKLANAAKPVGTSAKNLSIGYLLAQLKGMRNAHGQSTEAAYLSWLKQFQFGAQQSEAFTNSQKSAYEKGRLGKSLGRLSRYWNGGHLDIIRDNDLSMEMLKILTTMQPKLKTRGLQKGEAEGMIQQIEAALLKEVEDNKQAEVRQYADTMEEIFADLDTAMHLELAMSSKPKVPALEGAEKTKWRNEEIPPFKVTMSTVPMRLGYAKEPKAQTSSREGRFVADPIEQVSLDEAAFFGGIAKGEPFEKSRTYRPVMINGLSTPLSILDDSIYRLNVTPTYDILRRAVGRVRAPNGPIEITESGMMDQLRADVKSPENFETIKKYQLWDAQRYRWLNNANTALAAIAYELEEIVQNDNQIGTVNTGGAEVMRFLGVSHIVRALASPLQWWDQAASPSVGYTVGKLVAGQPRSVARYWQVLGKMLTSSRFRKQVREYIKKTSPFVYYRASDGQDVAEDVMGKQVRFSKKGDKATAVKNRTGKAVRGLEKFGEKTLSFTIGKPERILAGTIFMVEIAEKMGSDFESFEALLNTPKLDRGLAMEARLKVNDVMAQSDQSKKSWFFQTRDQNPTRNAFWRSIVRFSNHTASTASNAAVMSRAALTYGDTNLDSDDLYYLSEADTKASRTEAYENLATTLTQNILFFPFKLKTLLPGLLYLIFKGGDDDDDRAARRAQRVADSIIAPGPDANYFHRIFMKLLFGKKRQLFKDDVKIGDAQASAAAEILNQSLQEVSTMVPYAGVLMGYSPVRGMADRMIFNDSSEEIIASMTDAKRNNVRIREYKPGAIEFASGLAAPFATAYDYAAAVKLSIDYQMTRQAANEGNLSIAKALLYLMSELTPGVREGRSELKGMLQEPVREKKKIDERFGR